MRRRFPWRGNTWTLFPPARTTSSFSMMRVGVAGRGVQSSRLEHDYYYFGERRRRMGGKQRKRKTQRDWPRSAPWSLEERFQESTGIRRRRVNLVVGCLDIFDLIYFLSWGQHDGGSGCHRTCCCVIRKILLSNLQLQLETSIKKKRSPSPLIFKYSKARH